MDWGIRGFHPTSSPLRIFFQHRIPQKTFFCHDLRFLPILLGKEMVSVNFLTFCQYAKNPHLAFHQFNWYVQFQLKPIQPWFDNIQPTTGIETSISVKKAVHLDKFSSILVPIQLFWQFILEIQLVFVHYFILTILRRYPILQIQLLFLS